MTRDEILARLAEMPETQHDPTLHALRHYLRDTTTDPDELLLGALASMARQLRKTSGALAAHIDREGAPSLTAEVIEPRAVQRLLRKRLAARWTERADIVRHAVSAGLSPGEVETVGTAEDLWHGVIQRAAQIGTLGRLAALSQET